MKTKETSTLYTTMSNNIGQVKKENAQKEIERLNKQHNTKSWRIDESTFMFVEDETDEHVHNPCEKIEGYVWITCEPMSTREQAMAWKNTLDIDTQIDLCIKYNDVCKLHGRLMSNLTGREIEEIWKKETKQIGFIGGEFLATSMGLKPNQKQLPKHCKQPENCGSSLSGKCICPKPNTKQFKEANESLMSAYLDKFDNEGKMKFFKVLIDKFSEEDKVTALRVLFKSIGITSKDKLEWYLAKY